MCVVCGCGTASLGDTHPHPHDHDHGPGHSHDGEHNHSHGPGAIDFGQGVAGVSIAGLSQERTIRIERDILSKNDAFADANRSVFREAGVFALNLVSGPGSGKNLHPRADDHGPRWTLARRGDRGRSADLARRRADSRDRRPGRADQHRKGLPSGRAHGGPISSCKTDKGNRRAGVAALDLGDLEHRAVVVETAQIRRAKEVPGRVCDQAAIRDLSIRPREADESRRRAGVTSLGLGDLEHRAVAVDPTTSSRAEEVSSGIRYQAAVWGTLR